MFAKEPESELDQARIAVWNEVEQRLALAGGRFPPSSRGPFWESLRLARFAAYVAS